MFVEARIKLPLRLRDTWRHSQIIRIELQQIGLNNPATKDISHFLFHPSFPVDIRHNAKIDREQLAVWAAQELT